MAAARSGLILQLNLSRASARFAAELFERRKSSSGLWLVSRSPRSAPGLFLATAREMGCDGVVVLGRSVGFGVDFHCPGVRSLPNVWNVRVHCC